MKLISGNTPLIINRLPAIEAYLGKEYPLFYNTMDEASKLSNSIDKIVEAHAYLKKLDKTIMDRDTIIHKINQFIEQNL